MKMVFRLGLVLLGFVLAGYGQGRGGDLTNLVEISDDAERVIRLPLRVHLITGVTLEQKGVKMDMWVTPRDFEQAVLPELNRVWKAAGIEWVIESVVEQEAVQVPDREASIEKIQNAKRNAAGKSDPTRVPHLKAFCDAEQGHPVVNNLYVFPYNGQASQGIAAVGGNWAIVGVWTDKPSAGMKRPEKFSLVEKGSFRKGSIARTCAHELGHNLGLGHPDKATQTVFDRLMGGRKSGYDLIAEEIAQARETARQRGAKVLRWTEN